MVTPLHTMSTDDVPARERAPYWQDWIDRLFRGLDSDFYGDTGFDGQMRSTQAGEVVLTRLEANRHRVLRSQAQARAALGDRGGGLLKIVAPWWGKASVQQGGRRADVLPGQWSIYDTTDPYVIDNPCRVEHLIVVLPKAPFVQRGLALERLMARPLGHVASESGSSGSGAMARLALHTLRNAHHELPDMDTPMASSVGDTLIQLVALSLLELDGSASDASHKTQQLERIKQHVAARLGDPGLSVASVATALNCSRRQLYNTFADEPDGVAGYILRQRLAAARRFLDAPSSQQDTVTEVALRCGFTNLAHFSRVFRAHVGLAPSDYRRAGRVNAVRERLDTGRQAA